MGTLLQDLRYGARMLARNPGFTAVAVLTLALGIGANTAIFSLVNTVLLRPLPFKQGDRLVRLFDARAGSGQDSVVSFSQLNFFAVRERAQSFESVAAQLYQTLALRLKEGPEQVVCIAVSDGWLHTLGVQPVLGRGFTLAEERAGSDSRAVLLSYGLWQRQFGADPGIVGSTIVLDGQPHTVDGVMPRGFTYPYDTDLWRLWTFDRSDGRQHFLNVQARLKPSVTLAQARAEMRALSLELTREFPTTNEGITIWPQPTRASLVGNSDRAILLLFAAVGLVLLIACANVANLLLARSVARQKEFAIRSALGASRARHLRQLLTENVLLSLLGGALGAVATLWSRDLLTGLIPDRLTALAGEVEVDTTVLLFTIGVSIVVGVGVALVPAFRAARVDLQTALKEGERTAGAGGGSRLLNGLVVAEIALALVLLVGAGLMAQNLYRLQGAPLGFSPDHVMSLQVALPEEPYAQATPRITLMGQILEHVQALPDVEHAAVVNIFPLQDGGQLSGFVKAGEPDDPEHTHIVNHYVVTPGYFETMKVPLLRGRLFTDQDRAGAPPVVVVSRGLAERYWPGENPLGKRVRRVTGSSGSGPLTVVGVVGDVVRPERYSDVSESWYIPYAQSLENSVVWSVLQPNLVVRTTADPGQALASIRQAVWQVDNRLPVYEARTADDYYAETLAPNRVATIFALCFSAFGLLMAVLGIYGVMAYVVGRRTQEIGVRLALGAQPRDILALVLGQALVLISLGVAVGLAAALGLTRVMVSIVSEVSPTDPAIFAGVTLLLAAVALLACYIPARRAARVDPMVALRYE